MKESNGKQNKTFVEKHKVLVILTIISFTTFVVNLYKIFTFVSDPIFGDLGAVHYYLILFPSIIFLIVCLIVLFILLYDERRK